MADFVLNSTNALTVTQADVNDLDRAAVTRFHDIQIKRILAGDRTLGDNRDVIEQAFARHRMEAERRMSPPTAGATRIYVRWSNDGQHIRHWSREPFAHGLDIAQPFDAIDLTIIFHGIDHDYMTSETHHPGYVLIPAERFEALRAFAQMLDPLQ